MLSASWSDTIASIVLKMEQVRGIEPPTAAWKAAMLASTPHLHRRGTLGGDTPEKIRTLKKGEKIFFLFPVYIIQKFF